MNGHIGEAMNNTFYPQNDYRNYLAHYGVKGMKWGVRRYQNSDSTLTSAGKSRARKDGRGFKSRMKIRLQGATGTKWQERREAMEDAKGGGALHRLDARLGAGRYAADMRAKSYTQSRLARASKKGGFGEQYHKTKAYNLRQLANNAQRMHDSKTLGERTMHRTSNIRRKEFWGQQGTIYGNRMRNMASSVNRRVAKNPLHGVIGEIMIDEAAKLTANKRREYLKKLKKKNENAYRWATGDWDD